MGPLYNYYCEHNTFVKASMLKPLIIIIIIIILRNKHIQLNSNNWLYWPVK